MNLKRAEKLLAGCTVRKSGREVEVRGGGLGYRVAVARNGQIKSEDVEHLKTKIPIAAVMPPKR
jgi:hypothetical protein